MKRRRYKRGKLRSAHWFRRGKYGRLFRRYW